MKRSMDRKYKRNLVWMRNSLGVKMENEVLLKANTDLQGIRVLDLSRLLPGPACTWYLQSMGG